MRRYNINVKALVMIFLIFVMAVILLISLIQALFGKKDRTAKEKDPAGAGVSVSASASASPSPTALPTHSPRPSHTPEQSAAPAETPPTVTSAPMPDAGEVIAAICLEPPEEHSEDETLARLQILATYDNRFQDVIERLPGMPELTGFELSINPELLEFALNWPGDPQAHASFTAAEAGGDEPLLMQYDQRWAYVPYGSGPMAFNGCGPTCLSMVVLHFTGNPDATPDRTAKWALDNDYYVTGSGTKWTMFSEGLRDWGVGSKELPLWKGSILSALDKGNWVVMCMKKGNFTIYGHFIVVSGYTDEGFQVMDPFSRARSSILWRYEDIEDQISNLWAVGVTEDLMNAG